MRIALVLFVLSWSTLGVSMAQGSLSEHASEITKGQWYLIIFLIGIVQALIGFIYISGQKNTKDSIRVFMDEIKELKSDMRDIEKMMLDTRKTVIELHGEHKIMMMKCHKANLMEEEKNDNGLD